MKKQFIYDETGTRTGVILSIEEYNNLLQKHKNAVEYINTAKETLDQYLEFYMVDTDLKKFKDVILRNLPSSTLKP